MLILRQASCVHPLQTTPVDVMVGQVAMAALSSIRLVQDISGVAGRQAYLANKATEATVNFISKIVLFEGVNNECVYILYCMNTSQSEHRVAYIPARLATREHEPTDANLPPFTHNTCVRLPSTTDRAAQGRRKPSYSRPCLKLRATPSSDWRRLPS